MQSLLNMSSSSISDDNILNGKNEGDRMLQTAMKVLQIKVLSMNNPSKQAVIKEKLNDLKLLVSRINQAAKQKHAVIDQNFDEMQMLLDEEVKKQKLRIIERRCSVSSVSRTFQFGSSNLRITASKPADGGNNNGGLNESEIEVLTESMEDTISHIQQNYINQNNVDNDIENVDNNSDDDDDEYDLNEIFSQIKGEMEPEPGYGYDHCDNWMCYQCQHINPVTFEHLTDSNRKCTNCGSNGWPTEQEMDEMVNDSNIRYGEYFKNIMQ